MNHEFLLIRGGEVFDPEPIGRQDVLLFGGRIVAIGDRLSLPPALPGREIDAAGRLVTPGLVDLHVHLLGGGGEAGPESRVPEISLSQLSRAGITTVAGVLGTDSVTRSVASLLAKAKGISREGITTRIYTGSYHLPSVTVTGSVRSDVALIREVVGVKLAISDHRSSQPSWRDVARLASEARIGGMIGEKPGLVHIHVGSGQERLDPILQVVDQTEIPINQFLPTHVNRTPELLRAGADFVRRGGAIDLTVPGGLLQWVDELAPSLRLLKDAGAPWERLSLSSDGNGSMPKFDDEGHLVGLATGNVGALAEAVCGIAGTNGISLPEILSLVTRNPSARLGLSQSKGRIAEGGDADLVLWNDGLEVQTVIAKGRLLVVDGEPLVKGTFE